MSTLSELLNVNAVAVCDCKNLDFRVGLEAKPDEENHIRVLECSACGRQMAVPFTASIEHIE